jgi:hypothetical protein
LALYDKFSNCYDTTRKADPYVTGGLLFHMQPDWDYMWARLQIIRSCRSIIRRMASQ